MYRRVRRRVRPRFIIFIIALAVLVGGGVYFLLNREPAASYVVEGTLEGQRGAKAVVVRKETLYESDEYGKIEYLVAEGERVSSGASIANIYKIGYSETNVQELSDLEQKIHEYQQQQLKDFPNDSIHELNAQVSTKIQDVAALVRSGDNSQILKNERELKDLVTARSDYLRQTVVEDDTLNDLYRKYNTKKDEVNKLKQTVKSEGAGTVSFYYDKLETLLRPETVGSLTYDNINGIISGSSGTVPGEAKAQTPLYRLVDAGKWYLLVLSKGDEMDMRMGQSYTLSFPGYSRHEYTGTVLSHTVDKKGNTVDVLEINEDIGMLLSVRTTEIELGKRFSGLKVPARMIVREDAQDCVYVLSDSKERVRVPVNVVATDGTSSIVEPLEEGTLKPNMQVIK